MAQNITIQGLDGVTNANLDLATPVPIQRTNVDKFESVELNQIKNQIYARCETAGVTADKVAYLENFPKCKVNKGLCITVIFDNANTADNISLKLQDKDKNDISGFINIMAMNSNLLQLGAGSIPANSRVTLEYDGTYWLAHTDIVKSSASSVTHADGTISYTPISSLDESSPAPIKSAAIGNDLLRTSDVVSTITEGSASPISSGAVATIAPISSVDDTKNNSVNSTAVKAYAQPKLTAGSNISIENNTISCDVSTMNFKGAVDTYEDLPTTNLDIGDVYNITSTNDTYCWNGTEWVGIGTSVDLSGYVSSNEDNSKLWKGTKAEFDAIETKDSATTYIIKDEETEEIALLSADMVEDTVSGNADKIPNSLAVKNAIAENNEYSTEEKVVGTWIDGKPIYRKVFTGLSQSIGTAWTNINNVSISDIDEVVNGRIYANEGNSSGGKQFRAVDIGYLNGSFRTVSSGNVTINKFLVEYTKTTD